LLDSGQDGLLNGVTAALHAQDDTDQLIYRGDREYMGPVPSDGPTRTVIDLAKLVGLVCRRQNDGPRTGGLVQTLAPAGAAWIRAVYRLHGEPGPWRLDFPKRPPERPGRLSLCSLLCGQRERQALRQALGIYQAAFPLRTHRSKTLCPLNGDFPRKSCDE
jgi:hypothetical protein